MNEQETLTSLVTSVAVLTQKVEDAFRVTAERLNHIESQVVSDGARITALEFDRTRREALGWKQLSAAVAFIGVIAGIINVAVNMAT